MNSNNTYWKGEEYWKNAIFRIVEKEGGLFWGSDWVKKRLRRLFSQEEGLIYLPEDSVEYQHFYRYFYDLMDEDMRKFYFEAKFFNSPIVKCMGWKDNGKNLRKLPPGFVRVIKKRIYPPSKFDGDKIDYETLKDLGGFLYTRTSQSDDCYDSKPNTNFLRHREAWIYLNLTIFKKHTQDNIKGDSE